MRDKPRRGAIDDDFVGQGADALAVNGLGRATLPPAAPGSATVARLGDDFTFAWATEEVMVEVSMVAEHRDGYAGDLAVSLRGQELHWGRVALASTQGRLTLARRLALQDRTLAWATMIEYACRETVRALRAGAPIERLTGAPLAGPRYCIEPLWWHSDLSFLYADVGSLKGFVSLVIALVAASGKTIAGLQSNLGGPVPVLFLDYESNRKDYDDRLGRLCRGVGLDPDAVPLYYRPMMRPLAADLAAVRARMREHDPRLLVIDSWQPACCGSGREVGPADTALATVSAVRALGLPTLALAHLSKADAGQGGPARIYGSIFNTALSRCAWEIKRDTPEALPGEGRGLKSVLVGLTHRKVNNGRYRPPFALEFAFDGEDGPVAVSRGDLRAAGPEVRAKLTLGTQIEMLVADGAKTTGELAEALGKSANVVRAKCNDLVKQKRLTRPESGGAGAGDQSRWALPTTRAEA